MVKAIFPQLVPHPQTHRGEIATEGLGTAEPKYTTEGLGTSMACLSDLLPILRQPLGEGDSGELTLSAAVEWARHLELGWTLSWCAYLKFVTAAAIGASEAST